MLIDKLKHKNTLADLWHKVFGDSYDYIGLIFKEEYNNSILCFSSFDGETAVSAFYLLKCTLRYKDKEYKGCYLYAAATLEEYRKNGLMGRLINEAADYCRKSGFDFISLVPSNEGLYSYYARFGFKTAMYRREISFINNYNENLTEISPDGYYSVRSAINTDYINFDQEAFRYSSECLINAGFGFYSCGEGCVCVCNKEKKELTEFLPVSELNGSEKSIPFGMLCPLTKELDVDFKYTDIYMNIALD